MTARPLEQIAVALTRVLSGTREITAVRPMTTGFSNDTYLVEGPELVLRMPPAAGAMLDGHDVIGQADIYAELGRKPGAPPVPRIVHIEPGPGLLGAPFFLMAKVPGEAVSDIDLQPWFTDVSPGVRRKMCSDWVSAFAGLALLQPLELLGAPVSPEDDVRMWQTFAREAQCPALVDLLSRLLAVPAPISGAPAVVHGDSKLSNLMWQDYAITAMLDFEMSLNGEPMADLGYMLYQFESPFHGATRAPKQPGMLSRADVIALWEDVSGRSAAGIEWHEIAQIAKITAIIAEGTNMFNTGRSTDPKLAYFKQNLDHYLGVTAAMLDGNGF